LGLRAGTEVSLISSAAQWVRSRVVERVFFLEREDNMSALRKFIDAVNTGAVQLGKAVAVPAAKRPPPPETHAPPAPAAAPAAARAPAGGARRPAAAGGAPGAAPAGGDIYRTQNDNLYLRGGTCNMTSLSMGLLSMADGDEMRAKQKTAEALRRLGKPLG